MHRAKLNSQPDKLSVAGKQQLWQQFYDKTNITMDETENEFSSSDVIGVFLINFVFGPNHLFSKLNLVSNAHFLRKCRTLLHGKYFMGRCS